MIAFVAALIERAAKLEFLQGRRTLIAAIGLFGLTLYCLSVGQYEAGVTNGLFALGLLGLRFQFTPAGPILPTAPAGEGPTIADLFRQAETIDELHYREEPGAVFGLVAGASFGVGKARARRKERREEAIEMLVAQGVSRVGISVWLPILLALLQHLPEVIDAVKKIIDAIKNRKTPAQVAREEDLVDRLDLR